MPLAKYSEVTGVKVSNLYNTIASRCRHPCWFTA